MFIYIHILSYDKLFLSFNLCLSELHVCSFTSISFITNFTCCHFFIVGTMFQVTAAVFTGWNTGTYITWWCNVNIIPGVVTPTTAICTRCTIISSNLTLLFTERLEKNTVTVTVSCKLEGLVSVI